jgi:hypothetical protein
VSRPADGGSTAVAFGPSLVEVMLPGSAALVRAAEGVSGPRDVPLWMTRGGAAARGAAAASAAESAAVRRVAATLQTVLLDTSAALGWRGEAAQAAQARAEGLRSQLGAVASQLDAAHDALAELAAALEAQEPVLGAVPESWGRSAAEPDQQVALLRRWQPAVRALDAVDARAASVLRGVASSLARVHVTIGATPAGATSAGRAEAPAIPDDGFWAGIAHSVGSFCTETINGLASFANAMGRHPEATAELAAGYALMALGAGGEAIGTALDVTGIGAVAGVPANVVAAGAIATGAGMTASAVGLLAAQAAGDDHVTLMGGQGSSGAGSGDGGGQPPTEAGPAVPRLDIQGANYAQKTARFKFSDDGRFAGMNIDEVAARLRSGEFKPEDVPIDVIRTDGKVLILNTRSSAALREAGIPRSDWLVVDRSEETDYAQRLAAQLRRNNLDTSGVSEFRIVGRK